MDMTTTPALPETPYFHAGDLGFDPTDDVGFRSFHAQHIAAQTLAAQRTEWYLRSIRFMVLVWFVLFLIGMVVGVILGIVAVTADPEPASQFSF